MPADHLETTPAADDTVAEDDARLLADGPGPVADAGCGPGRITGCLHRLGLDVVGVDLSPGMLAVARRALPGPRGR